MELAFDWIYEKNLFYLVCFLALLITKCFADLTNSTPEINFTEWGSSVEETRLSITTSNNFVSAGSNFLLFIRMKNFSTNVVYIGESSPEADFIVTLKDNSGTEYKITREPFVFTRNMIIPLNPQEVRDWVLLADVSRHYEPHKISATNKNVPTGNHAVQITRTFKKNGKTFILKSNILNIKIE